MGGSTGRRSAPLACRAVVPAPPPCRAVVPTPAARGGVARGGGGVRRRGCAGAGCVPGRADLEFAFRRDPLRMVRVDTLIWAVEVSRVHP